MRRVLTVLLVMSLCLLAACVGRENAPLPRETLTLPPEEKELPAYQFQTLSAQEQFSTDDGTELSQYTYQLLTMAVMNAEDLSPETKKQAETAVETFNARMQELMDTSVSWGRELGDMAQYAYDQGSASLSYYDETTASGYIGGQIVSVRMDNSSYAGGAHPNTVTSGYVFDLSIGQFIDPAQVADDPAAFQAGAGALLLEQAEAKKENLDGYWPDYGDIIARWNEGTVLFDEAGMTVVYSPYELGPYAMGSVELFLSYSQLGDLLGEGGLERLGAAAE